MRGLTAFSEREAHLNSLRLIVLGKHIRKIQIFLVIQPRISFHLYSVLRCVDRIVSERKHRIAQLNVCVLNRVGIVKQKISRFTRLLTQFVTELTLNRALFPAVWGERKRNEQDLVRIDGTTHVAVPYWSILCRLVSHTCNFTVWWGGLYEYAL